MALFVVAMVDLVLGVSEGVGLKACVEVGGTALELVVVDAGHGAGDCGDCFGVGGGAAACGVHVYEGRGG